MAKKIDARAAFHKHKGIVMIVVGILILLNEIYSLVSWGIFVGGVVALLGLLRLICPMYRK